MKNTQQQNTATTTAKENNIKTLDEQQLYNLLFAGKISLQEYLKAVKEIA